MFLGRDQGRSTPASTPTRRFPANQIPALHFHALLNKEAEVELALV
jgi:hypothetical protein